MSQAAENKAPKHHEFWNVKGCARCADDHEMLEYQLMQGRPMIDADGTTWTHWAICPTTGDPIMGRKLDQPVGEGPGVAESIYVE